MIRFACPGCSATYTSSDEKAGKTSVCPKCKMQFVIPGLEDAPAPPPLPPPPRPSRDAALEIAPCPKCGEKLSVDPGDLGADVECPSCGKIFTARKLGSSGGVPAGEFNRAGREEKSPSGRGRVRDADEEEEDDRPRRRSRRDEEEDDDYDDRPRKRRRRYEPHRGVLVLVLGLIGFFVCPICAILAIIFGNQDLKAMDSRRMDPEGRAMTQIGRILGIVTIVLYVLFFCFYAALIFLAIGAGGGAPAGKVR